MTTRLGITLPFDGLALHDHRPVLTSLVDAGYTDIWTGEVAATDGFTPLALFAGWDDRITVTCGVTSVFTRGPAILAMTAASIAEAAPGRSRFGIGAGSNVIVEQWNGIGFERPYTRVADTLRYLRATLAGERAPDLETIRGGGFRLQRPPEIPPPLVLAALGPRMQELAAAEADGMMLNFVSAADVRTIRTRCEVVTRMLPNPLELSARVFVIPASAEAAETPARRHIAGYLTVPVYARFQEWLGRGQALAPMQEAWSTGDRKGAVKAIPGEVVRDMVIFGTAKECAASVSAYVDAGLDAITLYLLPGPSELSPARQTEFLVELAGLLDR